MIKAVALTDDESVVVGGYRDNNGGFLAAKLDTNGTVLWQWNVSLVISKDMTLYMVFSGSSD